MKKRKLILFQFLASYLLPSLMCIGIASTVQGQQVFPSQVVKTLATSQMGIAKSKTQPNMNKAGTIIWGAGSSDTTSSALGEFKNGFSFGTPPTFSSQWSAISINESAGNVTPGNAYWVRNTTGTSQGAYFGTTPPMASPTRANGVAIFDSDFLDNGGVAGAFNQGTSPSRHKGELISPSFDLTGYTDTAIALNFFCKWRNFQVTEFSASISVDGGLTWTTSSIMNALPSSIGAAVEGPVSIVFPNLTSGVTVLSNCKIKFTFDGDYYFAMIDDVSLTSANPYDLTIEEADPVGNNLTAAFYSVQVTHNAVIPIDQITGQGLRIGANVKNLGFAAVIPADNAHLNYTLEIESNGNWISMGGGAIPISNISSGGLGTAIIDSLTSPFMSVGKYRMTYTAAMNGDANASNNSLIQNFEIVADNHWSKVDLDANKLPVYDRPIFPGGTNFNRYEFGSVFSTKDGLILDSLAYNYYTTTNYSGTGSQVVKVYVYEWKDGVAGGTANLIVDDSRTSGELVIVGTGVDSLSGLFASGAYKQSMIHIKDGNGNPVALLPNSHYLVSLALEGNSFTSTNSIWLAASTAKNYAMNLGYSNGLIKSVSNLFLEDGLGNPSGNWLGFGADIVPSFGLFTSSLCSAFSAAITSTTNVSCNGGNNGATAASSTGGTSPYTYLWSNAATTASISNITSGAYTVTVTDANGCSATSSATITEPVFLASSLTSTNVSCNGGSNGATSASSTGGTTPYTYLWSNAATVASISNLTAGAYTVTVTDANGCIATSSATITEPVVLASSLTSTNVSCNGGSNGATTASTTGGTTPYTYLWSNAATVASISNLTAGAYTVTVTDANGCIATSSATITEPVVLASSMTSTNVSCNGGSNGATTASTTGGTTPYTYLWSNAATVASISNLTAGAYTVTVTDANGCVTASTATITQPTALNSSITATTNLSCNGSGNGTATVAGSGGTSPYTYLWNTAAGSQTAATATTLPAGSYSVRVTDANGCTASSSATITEPIVLFSSLASVNVSCNGGNNGTTTVNSSGGTTPYTYAWSNAATTISIANLTAGAYTVTVTDANGCSTASTATITEPTALASSVTSTNVSCNGGNNGTTIVSSTGGTTPYTYAWSNAATTASIANITAGAYTVTVTDANGCTITSTATITEPVALSGAIATTNVSCNGGSNGTAILTAAGGTAPYTYAWSNATTTNSITNLSAGAYTVTVTDGNGCTLTSSTAITEPAAIDTTVTNVNYVLTANQSGATYQWLDCNNNNSPIAGATMQSYSVLANGNYAVAITLNGCIDTSACVQIVNVGVNQLHVVEQTLRLFPNPNNGSFTVELTNKAMGGELQIYSISGKLLQSVIVNSPKQVIDATDLANGVYFIRLQNEAIRFIIAH